MSWTELDPGQGDPERVAVLAGELSRVAEAASSAQSQLQKLHDNASDAIWRGTSADAFRDRIEKLPGHLAKLARSYQDAADGFTGYSAVVRQIAHDATLVQTEVSAAHDGVSSTAREQAGYVAPAASPPTVNPYDQAVADAKSRLSNATGKLTHLADDRRVADARVKGALNHAHRDGMKNKSWWQKALTVVSRVLAAVTIVLLGLAVLAVVALAFIDPALIPALLVLAGQALTALSAAQLGVDGTRTALDEDVSRAELGLDALGCMPIVGALAKTLGAGEKFAAAAAKVPAALTDGARYLRTSTGAVRAGTGAIVKSLATGLKATRYVVRMADTGLGPRVFAGIERDGKDLGQMLTDAKDAANSAGRAAKIANNEIPQTAKNVLGRIDETGSTFPGRKGGSGWANDGRAGGEVLPRTTSGGESITYREWDVNPYVKGTRDGERIVTGSDGSAYYTNDHYVTFFKIRRPGR